MSKDQTLLNERLTAADEDIAVHQERRRASKKEIQRKQQLDMSPRIVLVSGNVHIQQRTPGPGLNLENTETSHVKEELEDEPSIKQEEEQLPVAPAPIRHSTALRQTYGSILFSAPVESDWIPLHCSDRSNLERMQPSSGFSNPDDGRKRKRKFDPKELKVLVDGVNAHYHELKKQNGSIARRNAIWQEITNRVNAVGHKDRTRCEIKRRWQDVRRRTKEKVATKKASAIESGADPSEHIPLDTIEEQVLLTLCEDEGNGIPGIDPFISDHDLCDNPPYNSPTASASSSHPPPTAPSPPWQETLNNDTRAGDFVDFDNAVLSEMKAQNTSVQDGLSILTDDIRSIVKEVRAVRGDTRAISKHTRDLVSAVTGLTAAVKELTKAVSERRPPQQQQMENGGSAAHDLNKLTHTHREGKK